MPQSLLCNRHLARTVPLGRRLRIKARELERLLPWAWKAERLAVAVDA